MNSSKSWQSGPSEFWLESYRQFFKGRKILLGVTGSIAAFKSVDIVRLLKKCGAEVRVILTPNAEKFVTALTLDTLIGEKTSSVFTSMWGEEATRGSGNDDHGFAGSHANSNPRKSGKIEHIELAKWADAILIAPATANTIAKLANGAADDLLSTEVLASRAPIYLAPAMNPTMLTHPATQANLAKLASYGYQVLETAFGMHACGDEGEGRFLEPALILENLSAAFCEPKNTKTVLISMGPTRSYLDPVRYLTNRSSGKMGAALAFAATQKGYQVEIVTGPTDVPLPSSAKVTRVSDTQEMADAVLHSFTRADYFFSTAAVLDFEFSETDTHKVKKENLKNGTVLFAPTLDILKKAGELKRKNQFILGFAAETQDFIKNAQKKLVAKNCDAVFVNSVLDSTGGFEVDENAGFLVSANNTREFTTKSKPALAHELAREILKGS